MISTLVSHMITSRALSTYFNILCKNMSYYAVANGRKPGIYRTWNECKLQVHQYSNPVFKKFTTLSEAESFIKDRTNTTLKHASSQKKMSTLSDNKESKHSADEYFPLGGQKLKQGKLTSNLNTGIKRNLSVTTDDISPRKTKKKKIEADNKATSDYIIDDDGYINVYTDGACSSNGTKNAQAGIGVWFGTDHPLNISQPVQGRATNNVAEIQAVTAAALQAKKAGIKKLKINTDSQFLISCITMWMPKWKRNGWKGSTNKPVINKVELIEMEEAIKTLDIVWNHVNGHAGIHGNEMADRLARQGAAKN